VNNNTSKLLTWVGSKIEIGAVISLLVAVATYVGDFYYRSYFDFYFIDSADIAIPLVDSIRTFAIILVVSSLLIGMVASAELRKSSSFLMALRDNVPLFVILILLSGWAIDIYWGNVESLSNWLSGTLKNDNLREKNEHLTLQVSHFLKWALLIAPLSIASVAVFVLSIMKFSFSSFLMCRTLGVRLLILSLYVLLVLGMASACGRAFAFLEFTGVLKKPEITVTLNDGKTFQEGRSLYLVVKSEGVFYVAARSGFPDASVKTWEIPQSMVKHVEFHSSKVNPQPFFDYMKTN
jgi:hypothetical protein